MTTCWNVVHLVERHTRSPSQPWRQPAQETSRGDYELPTGVQSPLGDADTEYWLEIVEEPTRRALPIGGPVRGIPCP